MRDERGMGEGPKREGIGKEREGIGKERDGRLWWRDEEGLERYRRRT
jgi:hypothetical protein